MSIGPTMGDLTEFIKEYLPDGFVMRIRFATGCDMAVYLYNRIGRVMEKQFVDSDHLPAVLVGYVNLARGMVDLEPVEGTWGRS